MRNLIARAAHAAALIASVTTSTAALAQSFHQSAGYYPWTSTQVVAAVAPERFAITPERIDYPVVYDQYGRAYPVAWVHRHHHHHHHRHRYYVVRRVYAERGW
ncbi:MAG: hypothetical protein M3N23_10635 [Pseudomonadota bacterium]|nr:hypothetical protein [Pseudomonadota bacterium]